MAKNWAMDLEINNDDSTCILSGKGPKITLEVST